METTNIYILIDPETQQVRYVGKANNISQRYKAHLNRARKHQIHKLNWINSLKAKKLRPIIEVIDIVPIEDWIFWETYWISQFKTWGFDLINYTNGGEGTTFGNQTSFKKGHKPWNAGLSIIENKTCLICNTSFKPHNTEQKTCSSTCANSVRTGHEKTQFKEGVEPWNKGKNSYKLGGLKTSRPVLQFTLQGEFVKEHLGCKEASLSVGCIPENIRLACIGKNKKARNFIWKYKN